MNNDKNCVCTQSNSLCTLFPLYVETKLFFFRSVIMFLTVVYKKSCSCCAAVGLPGYYLYCKSSTPNQFLQKLLPGASSFMSTFKMTFIFVKIDSIIIGRWQQNNGMKVFLSSPAWHHDTPSAVFTEFFVSGKRVCDQFYLYANLLKKLNYYSR